MKKFIFIIVLFFSTCVFAEGWEKIHDDIGIELYLSDGFEIISVNEFPREFSKSIAYTLVRPDELSEFV